MAKKVQTPPKSFEDALRELEQILSEIEGGEMGLEESLLKYERGNFLIHHCRGVLNNAEKQIDLLGKSPDGGLSTTQYPLPPAEAVAADRVTPSRGEPEALQEGRRPSREPAAGGQAGARRSDIGRVGNAADVDDAEESPEPGDS